MTIAELIQKLSKMDDSAEVFGTVWIDLHPFDNDGSDLSHNAEIPMKASYLHYHPPKRKNKGKLVIECDRWDYKETDH